VIGAPVWQAWKMVVEQVGIAQGYFRLGVECQLMCNVLILICNIYRMPPEVITDQEHYMCCLCILFDILFNNVCCWSKQ
jgi:hypothetical protein